VQPYSELIGIFDPAVPALTLLPEAVDGGGEIVCRVAGRIYNAEELRSRYGRSHASLPDLVAAVYRAGGADGLAELDGMFALALWDRERGRGVLAQDRIGVVSLFYAVAGGRLCFASELRDLLRLLPSTPPPDDVSLAYILVGGDPPLERTPYEGVSRLAGAHLLELDRDGWRRRRYWRPRYRSPLRGSDAELTELLWETVQGAVARRTADGARPGLIMSGGVDSSTVAAAAVGTVGSERVRAYSAVFPADADLDESERIGGLVAALGLHSVQCEVEPTGGVRAALEYLRRWSVPTPGPGTVLERPLAERAASDGVEILLDGQGGDEVFGLSPFLLADRIRHGRLLSSLRLARRFPLALEHPPWSQSLALWRMFGLKPAAPLAVIDRARRRRHGAGPRHLQPHVARLLLETTDPLAWRREADGPLWWAFKLELLLRGSEQARLAEHVRHRAAEVGIEARPPLLDLELIELVLRLPPEAHFDRRHDRPLIREGLRLGGVPDEVRYERRKSDIGGFYFRLVAGSDFAFIRELLTARDACLREYVVPTVLDDLREASPPATHRGNRAWSGRLWDLVVVETFLRELREPGFAEHALSSQALSQPVSHLHREVHASVSGAASAGLA
jgi:asparagine synthase (glutamine-hydrolysing)